MARFLVLLALFTCLTGCAGAGAFFGAIFQRAIASPGGVTAGRSSNPNVHCQTGPDGRTDCVEYRTSAPLRNGDPAPLGGEPYASTGANANASAGPASIPLSPHIGTPAPSSSASTPSHGASPTESAPASPPAEPAWQAPLAPAPQPLPPLTPP